MRLTRSWLACVGLCLAACQAPSSAENSPPRVTEPVQGQHVDRCLVRVHMTPPGSEVPSTANPLRGDPIYGGSYASWRVNGGPEHQVNKPTTDRSVSENFTFGVTLQPGHNQLELARCDEFRRCGWTALEVEVDLVAGSPDCGWALGGAWVDSRQLPAHSVADGSAVGAVVQEGNELGRTLGVLPLADGRVLVGTAAEQVVGSKVVAGTAVIALRPDGSRDPAFGTNGLSFIGLVGVRTFFGARAGGGWLLLLARPDSRETWLGRLDASGRLEEAFGDPSTGIPGLRAGATAFPLALRPRPDGRLDLIDGAARSVLDEDGAVVTTVALAPWAGVLYAASVDGQGRGAVLFSNGVMRLTSSGALDTSWGTGGRVPLEERYTTSARVLALDDGRVVVGRPSEAGATITTIDALGQVSTLEVPVQALGESPILLAAGPNGTLYVAATALRPVDQVRAFFADGPEGSQLAVARLSGAPLALDLSFGDAGVARGQLGEAWLPASNDTLTDVPSELLVDDRGGPWLFGASASTAPGLQSGYTRRGPGPAAMRFRP